MAEKHSAIGMIASAPAIGTNWRPVTDGQINIKAGGWFNGLEITPLLLAPNDLAADDVQIDGSDVAVSLSWTGNDDAAGYRVYRQSAGATEAEALGDVGIHHQARARNGPSRGHATRRPHQEVDDAVDHERGHVQTAEVGGAITGGQHRERLAGETSGGQARRTTAWAAPTMPAARHQAPARRTGCEVWVGVRVVVDMGILHLGLTGCRSTLGTRPT